MEEYNERFIDLPERRLPQVVNAVEDTVNSDTAIGIKGCDGFVLAIEKSSTNPLLDTTEIRKIIKIDRRIGAVCAGRNPDCRYLINKARTMANEHLDTYFPLDLDQMVQNLSEYMHENSLHHRPFNATFIYGSYVENRPRMYLVEKSGAFESYNGCAIGRAAEAATSEIEKIDFLHTSIEDLVKKAAKIIYMVHEDRNNFELELSWCGEITRGIHEAVPPDVFNDAKEYAKDQNGDTSDSPNT